MNTKTALSIENITSAYGGVPVINDINLSIERGEFFGLIGLNGAGKTTLIKTILGLMDPERGDVRVFDEKRSSPKAKIDVAYLPERFEPPWFLSGIEFLKFSMSLYNQKISEDDLLVAADRLALDRDALKRKVQTYSKGMRQKLGLLGTILTGCKLLILDEPMSGLDPRARALVKDYLGDVKKEGRTIFLSSHILADMDEICDRISVLYESKLQFTNTPKKLKTQTKTDNLERAFLRLIQNDGDSIGCAA